MAYHLNRTPTVFRGDFGKLIDSMFGSLAPAACAPSAAGAALIPAIDVTEAEEAYIVRTELPGVAPEDVEISVEDGLLTVRGEKQRVATTESETARRSERVYGSFERKLKLPATVDGEGVSATAKDGVLTLTLPKRTEAKARRIAVSIEG